MSLGAKKHLDDEMGHTVYHVFIPTTVVCNRILSIFLKIGLLREPFVVQVFIQLKRFDKTETSFCGFFEKPN
ncbi:MAG: hypothetical protein EAY75_10285 [Bacteroidetes bacterium]|nr:MAG: hypothetical protein EAY75_10285 [Bacteroidota bacterium]